MSSNAAAVKLDGLAFPSGDDVGAFVVDLGSLYVQAGNAGTLSTQLLVLYLYAS